MKEKILDFNNNIYLDREYYLSDKDNYYEFIKNNLSNFKKDNIYILIDLDTIKAFKDISYRYIDFKNRGVIYFDENVNEFISYVYNHKLKSYIVKEAKFENTMYKVPNLCNDACFIKSASNKKQNKTR